MLSLLSLLSIRLTDHIFYNDIKDFSNRIAILQYLPRLIRMEMNLHQIFITCCEEEKLEGLEGGAAFHIHGGVLV